MSGRLVADVLALTGSLFNTILLVWLGLTVLFNAERRNWGVILAICGLLIGAVFFIGHSIILVQGARSLIAEFGFWWHAGWLPLIAAPYAWYLLMLWYNGYWDTQTSTIRNRQRPFLIVSFAFTTLLLILVFLANPLPSIAPDATIEADRLPGLGSVPLIFLLYSVYILFCIGLSLDALRHPAPAGRFMGDLARKRARPWLAAASLVLLLVSLLVGIFLLYLIISARRIPVVSELLLTQSPTLSIFDLVLTLMLSAAILLVGQAIVSYEIFTGRTLPRQGFIRQWRITVILAASLSLMAALATWSGFPVIFSLLGILLLVTGSYALFGWQSYNERLMNIRQLRPLAVNQHLFESILSPPPASLADLNLAAPFQALCHDFLETRKAVLLPLGALAALDVPPLCYPDRSVFKPAFLYTLAETYSTRPMDTSPLAGQPLDPAAHDDFIWVTPLWNERGLAGLLFLGEKEGGGIYSMEEMELARTNGERFTDLLASTELARRLIVLQRQRMAADNLRDQRARRVLHDEVLPQLHTAILQLSRTTGSMNPDNQDVADLLASAHRQVSDLLHYLPSPGSPNVAKLGIAAALHQVIERELPESFDQVVWSIDPEAEHRARTLPPLAAEVVYFAAREALRNAARHARPESGNPHLDVRIRMGWNGGLILEVEDNGVGIPPAGIDTSNNGQGISLHGAMMAVINGSLSIESAVNEYTRVILELPETSLATWKESGLPLGQSISYVPDEPA